MKKKIIEWLGKDQVKHVEAKAKALGIDDVVDRAIVKAKAESDATASEDHLVELAAIRAQQMAGCIPRGKFEAKAGAGSKEPGVKKTDAAGDTPPAPGSTLPA